MAQKRNLERELVLKHKISWKEARDLVVTAKKELGEKADDEKIFTHASSLKEPTIEPTTEPTAPAEPQEEKAPLEDTTNTDEPKAEETEVKSTEMVKTSKEDSPPEETPENKNSSTLCGALDCLQ